MPLGEDFLSGKPILDFYAERGRDDRGRGFSQILAWDDARLEEVHDYIQWLFPLPERSAANPQAPVLDRETIASFHASGELQAKLRRAFLRMLEFYGLVRTHEGVARAPDFPEKSGVWLRSGNHNHLRLTRILRSLCLLGLERDARSLFDCLRAIYEDEEARPEPQISARTLRFWMEAVGK